MVEGSILRVIHVSDLHLGVPFKSVRGNDVRKKINDNILSNLKNIVNYVVENEADLFLLTGDIFNSIYLSNFYSHKLVSTLRRLYEERIPIVMIAGNHDAPKIRGFHIPLRVFNEIGFEGLYFYEGTQDKPLILDIGGFTVGIIVLPYIHMRGDKDLEERVSKYIRGLYDGVKSCDYKLLLVHYDIKGARYSESDPYSTSYFSVYRLPPESLNPDLFNYVALGHIHLKQGIPGYSNMFYSGSIERVNFGEANEKKGFLVIDIEGASLDIKFVETDPVRMVVTPILEVGGLDPVSELVNILDAYDTNNSLLRVRIRCDPGVRREIRENISRLDAYLLENRNVLGYRLDFEERRFFHDFEEIEVIKGTEWLLNMIYEYIESVKGVGEADKNMMKRYVNRVFEEVERGYEDKAS
jgi:exonuclease SbcD